MQRALDVVGGRRHQGVTIGWVSNGGNRHDSICVQAVTKTPRV